jgi:hypothetical protein
MSPHHFARLAEAVAVFLEAEGRRFLGVILFVHDVTSLNAFKGRFGTGCVGLDAVLFA